MRRLAKSIAEALQLKGFRFIEVLSQCPTVYGRRNNMPTGLDMLKFFKENCVIKNYAHPKDVEIKPGKKIIIGKFVDKTEEKLSFEDKVWNLIKKLERGK